MPAALGGVGVDIGLTAPSGTRLGDVWRQVLAASGRSATEVAFVGGVPLKAEDTLGVHPLLDGAEISVSPPDWTQKGPVGLGPAAPHGEAVVDTVAPLVLVAVSGPDAGRTHRLRPGRLVVGRHESCDLVVADPDMSRRQCEVLVSAQGVRVRDLTSTNGTLVTAPRDGASGQPVGVWAASSFDQSEAVTMVALGGQLRMGSTRLEVRLAYQHEQQAATGERGDGTVVHAPSPRRSLTETPRVFTVPPPPGPSPRRRIPWLSALLPLAIAIPIAVWWGSAVFLLMGLAGPAIVIGSVVSDRRDSSRTARTALAEHTRAVAATHDAAARAAADVLAIRHQAHPDAAVVLDCVLSRTPRLWQTRNGDPEAFSVRVGTADLPGPVRVETTASRDSGAVSAGETLRGAPLTADVAAGAVVQGPTRWRAGVTRAMVGRLVTAIGPDDLRVMVVTGSQTARDRWSWTRWLPHLVGADPISPDPAIPDPAANRPTTPEPATAWALGLADLLAAVTADTDRTDVVLVVADDIPARDLSGLEAVASTPGVMLLVSAELGVAAPRHCRTRLYPAGESTTGIVVESPEGAVAGIADQVAPWWAARLARGLAPVRPAANAGKSRIPDEVSLASLLRTDGDARVTGRVTATEVTSRWRTTTETGDVALRLPLAAAESGPVTIDLVGDGPHALIAGTTGSGKSELLRSLVLGLACRYPPTDVAFLLVDFKGGNSLGVCAGLPHALGLLTDLDTHQATRVLAGLEAEIRRRERVLAQAGVVDLAAYRRAGHIAPLPRLVCVVDEFRVLAEQAPDILDGLVHVASVGRSLGVHLILATQRPAGVVSADIRANTALRIALRVQDAGDSRDVIDCPDAATLPRLRPGRAIVARDGALVTVQTARVGAPESGHSDIHVWRMGDNPCEPIDPTDDRRGADSSTGESAALAVVSACRDAAAADMVVVSAPWLPPLPSRVTVDEVASLADGDDDHGEFALELAMADLPALQRRAGVTWRPASDGLLVVLGGPASGRTTTLHTLAGRALAKGAPVVIVTGDAQSCWPAGTQVVDWRDLDLLYDVVGYLTGRVGADDSRWLFVGVDDCDGLLHSLTDRPDMLDRLMSLSRDASVGRTAMAWAGGRALGTSRLATGGRLRLMLRPSDPFDAALVGASVRDLPRQCPPGRGLLAGTGLGTTDSAVVEVHVAVHPAIDPASRPLLAEAPGARVMGLPQALPGRVSAAALGPSAWPLLSIGLCGPEGLTAQVDVAAGAGAVIVGPSGSGRSTALYALAAAAQACGIPLSVLAADSGAWMDRLIDGDEIVTDPRLVRHLLGETGRRLLVVDDFDLLAGDIDDLLMAVLNDRSADDSGGEWGLAVATTATHLAAQFRGYAAAVRRHGSALLLHPGRHDARDVLSATVVPQSSTIGGRGVLVNRGRWCRVQVATTVAPGPDAPRPIVPAPPPAETPPPRTPPPAMVASEPHVPQPRSHRPGPAQ